MAPTTQDDFRTYKALKMVFLDRPKVKGFGLVGGSTEYPGVMNGQPYPRDSAAAAKCAVSILISEAKE